MYLYVLLLEYGKYFVDITSNAHFELINFENNVYEWTTVYRPLKIVEFLPGCQREDVNLHFLYYVRRFGIEHVRCCNFGTFGLTEQERGEIHTLLETTDMGGQRDCYLCGTVGEHYTKDCPNLLVRCYACGQVGHEIDDCRKMTRTFEYQHYTSLDDEETSPTCWSCIKKCLLC